MDVVYILGEGSLVNNLEMFYSLRALQQHMRDLRNVYIVGICPRWLRNVEHLAVPDVHEKKWKNAHTKILAACAHPDLSDEFLLMNDDFFVTADFNGSDFPFYAQKNIDGGPNGKRSFSIHCPIRLHKEYYAKLPIPMDGNTDYSPRSFYCNFMQAPAVDSYDCIVRTGEKMPPFGEQIKGKKWFSISNDAMLDIDFMLWLGIIYPTPSKYE